CYFELRKSTKKRRTAEKIAYLFVSFWITREIIVVCFCVVVRGIVFISMVCKVLDTYFCVVVRGIVLISTPCKIFDTYFCLLARGIDFISIQCIDSSQRIKIFDWSIYLVR